MRPDLMGDAAVEPAFQLSPIRFAPKDEKVRSGGFAFFHIDARAVGAVGVDFERRFEADFVPGGQRSHLRQVALDGLALAELPVELTVRAGIPCQNHQPTGFLIEPVYHPEPAKNWIE